MDLIRHFGSYENVEKRLAEIRAQQRECDVCAAPAYFECSSFMGRYRFCCKAHEPGAIDHLLDIDEDDCEPVPVCECARVAAR
jgi:hypothetical protein